MQIPLMQCFCSQNIFDLNAAQMRLVTISALFFFLSFSTVTRSQAVNLSLQVLQHYKKFIKTSIVVKTTTITRTTFKITKRF